MPVSPPPILTPYSDTSASGVSRPWLKWFQEVQAQLNRALPGPFANDAAAAQAGVQVGFAYYQASGAVVVRLA